MVRARRLWPSERPPVSLWLLLQVEAGFLVPPVAAIAPPPPPPSTEFPFREVMSLKRDQNQVQAQRLPPLSALHHLWAGRARGSALPGPPPPPAWGLLSKNHCPPLRPPCSRGYPGSGELWELCAHLQGPHSRAPSEGPAPAEDTPGPGIYLPAPCSPASKAPWGCAGLGGCPTCQTC